MLLRRSGEATPNGMVTIVQGVAVALLAVNAFEKPTLLGVVQSFTLLLILACVFYWHVTVSVLLRRTPSVLDCLLPFALAVLEIPPAFFLGDARSWNLWLSIFWSGIVAGLWLTRRWSLPAHFGKVREAHRTLHDLVRHLQMVAGVGALAMAFSGIFAFLDWTHQTFWGLLGAATVLATLGVVVFRTEHAAARIHELYGVSRPAFG